MDAKNRRLVVGPRGGEVIMAVTCLTCVSLRSCNPAPCTEPWGCESWVDMDRHRVVLEVADVPRETGQIELF
jgi:hypothetical protein